MGLDISHEKTCLERTDAGICFERIGRGDPLLLIHGTGASRSAWRPVVPLLSPHHELILVDLPGHGDSCLANCFPNPLGYAPLVGDVLDRIGATSAHVAGFSVGGWTALELAKVGRARSVVGLGPAGLWSPRSPLASEASLWATRQVTRWLAPLVPLALRWPAGRTIFLAQQFGRPWRLPADAAVQAANALASTQGFREHLRAVNSGRFTGGQDIDVPITIAFGGRERLLSKRGARRREELPRHARWVELPGCGHVPTWDDPPLVASVILETTSLAGTGPRPAGGSNTTSC